MRKDVKIGLVMSLILVVLAGWYYGRPTDDSAAIQLDDAQTMAKRLAEKKPAKVQTVPPPKSALPEESTIADRRGSDPSQHTGDTKPLGNRAAHDREGRTNNELANRGSDESTARLPALGPEARPDESDQLDVLDKLVRGKSDQIEPGGRVDRVNIAGADAATSAAPVGSGDDRGAMERHHVRSGETLVRLAEIYYGDDKLVSLLAKANPELPLTGPLPKEATVRIPPRENNEHDFSDRDVKLASAIPAAPSKRDATYNSKSLRTYKVKDGDSFYTIAAHELGEASRWPELYDINKEVVGNDPNRLRAGQLLKLPAGQ